MISHSIVLTAGNALQELASEGPNTFEEVPTLPGWQALILLIVLICILVLALYGNARVYQAPVYEDRHGQGHQGEHGHAEATHDVGVPGEQSKV